MYRFKENWASGGTTIWAGVAMKGPFEIGEDCVSKPGSSVFKNIPLSILEKIEATKIKKKRAKKIKPAKKIAKSPDESARISSKKI